MPQLCRLLLLAALCVSALTGPADAQFRNRGQRLRRNPVQAQPVADTAPADEAPAQPPTVEELLRRLDELEGRTNQSPPARERRLALLLEDVRLSNTNFYADGIRYFSARLLVINLTEKPVTLPTSQIVLVADKHEYTLADARKRLARSIVQIGNQAQQVPVIPDSLEVPPQGTASTWVVYAGLESALNVPSLLLKLTWNGGAEELDINAYERGVLGLRVERLGPRDCAALLTVNGQLNTVNAGTLSTELEALTADGVMRVVVAWGETAATVEDQVLGWLSTGTSQDAGMQYGQMPQIPSTIREFHVVQPAGETARQFFAYSASTPIHPTPEEAMAAALRTAFEVVPHNLLRHELAHGHRLSRAAALEHAGASLSRRELPLVLAAANDEDPYIRRQALAALGQFGDQEAIDRLLQAAASIDQEISAAAIHSLAGSRYPRAQLALAQHLDTLGDSQVLHIIEILASHPREEWIARIARYYESSDPQVRLAALNALVQLGHADIVSYLAAALASAEPELRSAAFAQLAQRTDPRSEMLALTYALELLKTIPPDAATHALLIRTRDQRALPLLFNLLDAMPGDREQMIELIAQIGGANVIPQLQKRYAQFTPAEQATVLDEMLSARSANLRPLAVEALASGDPQLVEVAARILTVRPDQETVTLLSHALAKAESIEAWSTLCNALANVGDAGARAALMAVRDQEDRARRDQVVGALTRIKHTSPAYQYAMQATQEIDAGEQQKARKLLDLAIMFDPDYSEAYSQRGHLLLLQQEHAEAKRDFEQAIERDPYDSLAITGRAIVTVMQGDAAGGVEQIVAAADKFTGDARFEYNAACVYGRAVESLQETTNDEDRKRRDDYQTAALGHLRQSIKHGFNMPDFIKQDPDLAVLHGVPEFEELLTNSTEMDGNVEPFGEFELDMGTLR